MLAELQLKAVADATRLKILSLLMDKPKFVEEIAKELDITVSTASFHLKKLQAVGFVVSKKEQYYQTYSINVLALKKSILDIVEENKCPLSNAFDEEVIGECFDKSGKLISYPIQIKKQDVCLREIIKSFKKDKIYTDKQANILLADFYDDFILIKNDLIERGYLKRTSQGLKVNGNRNKVKINS